MLSKIWKRIGLLALLSFVLFVPDPTAAQTNDCESRCLHNYQCIRDNELYYFDEGYCQDTCGIMFTAQLTCCGGGGPDVYDAQAYWNDYTQYLNQSIAVCTASVPVDCPAECLRSTAVGGTCIAQTNAEVKLPKECLSKCGAQNVDRFISRYVDCCNRSTPVEGSRTDSSSIAVICRDAGVLTNKYTETSNLNVENQPKEFRPVFGIPGSEFEAGRVIDIDGGTFGQYIAAVFTFSLGVISVVALVMIVFGGYIWLTAAGNQTRISQGKEFVVNAIIGLVLGFGSYFMLNFINPQLISIGGLRLADIRAVRIANLSLNDLTQEVGECVAPADIQTIPSGGDIIYGNVSDPRLTSNTVSMLTAAAAQVNSEMGAKLTITSAFRSKAFQAKLRACYELKLASANQTCPPECTSQGIACNEAARADCNTSPHLTGLAVDVCVNGSGFTTCDKVSTNYNGSSIEVTACPWAGAPSPCTVGDVQKKLQEIMASNGFSRYCGEWWHFEATAMSPSCAPGSY